MEQTEDHKKNVQWLKENEKEYPYLLWIELSDQNDRDRKTGDVSISANIAVGVRLWAYKSSMNRDRDYHHCRGNKNLIGISWPDFVNSKTDYMQAVYDIIGRRPW